MRKAFPCYDVKATRRDYGTKILVTYQSTSFITFVCTLTPLSHARITFFPAHQDVINVRICISTIQRPAEFQHCLALNHTNLVQSQVVGSDPYPNGPEADREAGWGSEFVPLKKREVGSFILLHKISSDPWPSNFKHWWLTKKLGFSVCVTSW